MTDTILTDLHNKAQEFGSIARLVNEASRVRKSHTDEAIGLIKQSMEISDILSHEFDIISRANRTMRDHDTMILNTCRILQMNIARQREIIRKLKDDASIDAALLNRMDERSAPAVEHLAKAITLLESMSMNDNEIILMDNLIIHRRLSQRESIDRLKKLAFRILEDAENAIRGSSSNLRRGLQFVEQLGRARELIAEGSREELEKLADEANTGWNIAAAVNRSSITQFVFAEQVHQFTEKLHEETIAIRDLVLDKHLIFQRNLELATELAVVLSLEIREYLAAADIAEAMNAAPHLSRDTRYLISNLKSFVAIACRDIQSISSLNFDMSESINLNVELENKSVEMTGMKLEYFERIRESVRSMTDSTKYPIEGSGKNIENGRIIESYVRTLIEQIS